MDASALYGTWIDPESDWGDTFVFNPDGTGVLVSGPQYPYTYTVSGSTLTITYDDGDEESFEVSVSSGKPVLIDQFGSEIKLEPSSEKVEIIEKVDYSTALIGTWVSEEDGETYAFNADGTGYQIFEGTEYGFTYEIDEDHLWISYDDGDSDSCNISVDGDILTIADEWTYIRQ